MSRNALRKVVSSMALWAGIALAAQRPSTFTSFDFPGATTTGASGINADGAVVGSYNDSAGKTHGYLLSAGTFTAIDYPGALSTSASGINSQGDIVGNHVDAAGGASRGFLLRQGVFSDVNFPGHLNTVLVRITDGGQIVGCYHDLDGMSMHGFMFSDGNYSDLSVPASMNTGVIPDGSVTAGHYTDMTTGVNRGYLASAGGFAGFDFPFSTATAAADMSASGEVLGAYTDSAKNTHGFLLTLGDAVSTFGVNPPGGMAGSFDFVSIDYPGARATRPNGINSHGDLVGSYDDSAGKSHGFLLSRGRRGQN